MRVRRSLAPTLLDPARDPPEAVGELTVDISLTALGQRARRQHHHVESGSAPRRSALPPEALPDEPPRPVPQDRAPDPSTHGQAQPIVTDGVRDGDEKEHRARHPHALFEDPPELGAAPEPHRGRERRPPAHHGSGSDALAAFLAPALEHEAPALGPHPNQEPVSPLSPPVVGLERPLHGRYASRPQGPSAGRTRSCGTKLIG